MLWLKRIICGIVALIFIFIGARLIHGGEQVWQAIGFCILVGGITLAHIAIVQQLPKYNFWITLTAAGLAYALYSTHNETLGQEKEIIDARLEYELEKSRSLSKQEKIPRKEQKKKRETGFDPSAYPKISGSANVIHAHVFYIGGRYVRLFGVDAPDNDQICSDANGSSYNCGEEAVSWVRGWIDNNPIDCYLLKIEPNGQDLATCFWGEYDIGAGLVGAGWALANTRESDIYRPYEAKAKSESSGLWQGTFYAPEDWRDIKRRRNDFTIKRTTVSKGGGFFDFGSWFK